MLNRTAEKNQQKISGIENVLGGSDQVTNVQFSCRMKLNGSDLKFLNAPQNQLQLSSVHSQKLTDELNELSSALNQGCFIDSKEKSSGVGACGDFQNMLNFSKDDEESIINMLKDYVTIKLGNGNKMQIPKLNLVQLSIDRPEHIQFEIS